MRDRGSLPRVMYASALLLVGLGVGLIVGGTLFHGKPAVHTVTTVPPACERALDAADAVMHQQSQMLGHFAVDNGSVPNAYDWQQLGDAQDWLKSWEPACRDALDAAARR